MRVSSDSSALRGVFRTVALAAGLLAAVPGSSPGQDDGAFSKRRIDASGPVISAPVRTMNIPDVLHYDLDLWFAMTEETMGGRVSMRLQLTDVQGGGTDRVVVQAAQLTVDSVRIDGAVCSVLVDVPAEEIALIPGNGRLFQEGETLLVVIDYRRLPGLKRPGSRWGYYFFRDSIGIPANLGYTMSEPSDARYWLPCHDDPSDKATADIRATVPEGYVAASNGALLGVVPRGQGRVQWQWRERHPIAPYLLCVTASRFTVSTLPFLRAEADTIPLQYYVWAADSVSTAAYLPTVHAMMTGLSALFGPYPFDKYGMTAIVPFGFGGMEHQTITTMNRYLKTDERVVVHELAHQWWGNLVTCATWPDIWLNESFATYAEALWEEWKGGKTALRSYMVNDLEHFFFGSWLGAVYDPEGQGYNLFDDLVYSKGAWILHTLRGVIGDSAFFGTLHAYRARHAGGNATTDQFRSVVDSVTGTSMAWFFDQWIYGKGWPVYGIRHTERGDSVLVTITQEQQSSWPVFRMPLVLKLIGEGRDSTVTVLNAERSQVYGFLTGFRVDSVALDPENAVLKQVAAQPVSVAETGLPSGFALDQNYPNPFNGTTVLRFEVPAGAAGRVRLLVHDLLGRQVASLHDGEAVAGGHRVVFDASGLASGVYVATLQAGTHRLARPMVLLR